VGRTLLSSSFFSPPTPFFPPPRSLFFLLNFSSFLPSQERVMLGKFGEAWWMGLGGLLIFLPLFSPSFFFKPRMLFQTLSSSLLHCKEQMLGKQALHSPLPSPPPPSYVAFPNFFLLRHCSGQRKLREVFTDNALPFSLLPFFFLFS